MHRRLAATAALVLWSTLAYAHPGGPGHDFTHGFAHPIGGLDHVLAMVAVGLLAAQMGGRALWLVPGAFVITMAAAAWFAMGLSAAPGVELGIAASVLMIGAAVALPLGLPANLAAAMVGIFAVFHGLAHGVEMPATSEGLSYGLGFVAATVLLHALGIGAGLLTHSLTQPIGGFAVRLAGGAIAVIGVLMIVTGTLA